MSELQLTHTKLNIDITRLSIQDQRNADTFDPKPKLHQTITNEYIVRLL